jgi:Tfp pilus assembly protein PilP
VPVEVNESDVKAAGSTPAAPGVAAAGQGFTYNKENRRDPFVPLLKGQGKEVATTTVAARVAGLGGLGTSEVTLRGVLASQGGYLAMLQGADDKTYIVRTGDRLADGTIHAITSEMMVIQQQIKDPLSRQKEREVRKMLRHTDGTN